MKLETIRIAREDSASGFAIINASDFDEDAHDLFEDAPQLTRDSLAKMSKEDVRDLLEAHGVEDIPKGVDDMRKLAERVIFLGDAS